MQMHLAAANVPAGQLASCADRSTGSRVHVYRYYTSSSNNSPWAAVELPEAVHKTTPGLSSYAFEPKTAANSLQPLLKFAKEKVPEDQWSRTPIQLMATAGLRMLSNGSADHIMTEVCKTLVGGSSDKSGGSSAWVVLLSSVQPKSMAVDAGLQLLSVSGFEYQEAEGARVLTGAEEGIWGWVAINYATGALQAATTADTAAVLRQSGQAMGRRGMPGGGAAAQPAEALQGVLELGGASLQVTVLPQGRLPPEHSSKLVLPALGPGKVFSKSFDGWGLQASHAQWTDRLTASKAKHDPCLPKGYRSASGMSGSGNFKECRAGVGGMLPVSKGNCSYQQCGLSGSFLPNLKGVKFRGLDNFYYTAHALGLPADKAVSIRQIEAAAKTYCGHSWSALKSRHMRQHSDSRSEPYVLKVCFSSALIVSLLQEGLQLEPAAEQVIPSNSVPTPRGKMVEVNWALGALIVEVLELGGRTISRVHNHILLAPPGSEHGASDAMAAALAAGFCLSMLLLTGVAQYFKVGVICNGIAVPVAANGGGGGGGGGANRPLQPLTGHANGTSSNVKYQRLRPVTPLSHNGITQQERDSMELSPLVSHHLKQPVDRRSSTGTAAAHSSAVAAAKKR
eukprot:gene10826-10982_t